MAGAEAWARRHGLDDRTGRCLRRKAELRRRLRRGARRPHASTSAPTSRPRSSQHAATLAGDRPSRRSSASAPSRRPCRCSRRSHARGVRVLLPVLLADMDLDWAVFTGAADAGGGPAADAGAGRPAARPRRDRDSRPRAGAGARRRRHRYAARPGRRLVRPGPARGPPRRSWPWCSATRCSSRCRPRITTDRWTAS